MNLGDSMNMTREEKVMKNAIERVKNREKKKVPVRVDSRTIILVDKKNKKEAVKRFLEKNEDYECKSRKHNKRV